ncbi:Maf family protein [Pseudogemmobacter humi]|uniref:Nucleoside triphosphate pyrophosphatase n=1 Tax=Pseudogemmobacter humi TaxID=2483812 RepID=A0A3P5X3W2_9RHOB|nr:Maf family protein [Pseudogemmobacter humi]VDC21884.1 Maf-like protein YceF [Pseudogemmobacter humi]
MTPEKAARLLPPLVLASTSATRIAMLEAAGLSFESLPARVDEESIRRALEAEGASPRDMADTLAEVKARKIAEKRPDALVIGCDQILELNRRIFAKPETPEEARENLLALRGKTHRLLSAAVVYEEGKPVWRHVSEARLTMRDFSEAYLDSYIPRNWEKIRHSVGGYRLEEEGVRLFSALQGDHFTILGMPLLPLLSWLSLRGIIPA